MKRSEAEAVILNPHSKGGKGLRVWKSFLNSEFARSRSLEKIPVFDGSSSGVSKVELFTDLKNWTAKQLQSGRKNFVACGGDGTVNLAVNALRGTDACLGAIGLGSSNDFHKPFKKSGREKIMGIPTRLNFDRAYPHDLGLAEFNSESTYFAINSSIGLVAEANDFFNSPRKWFGTLKRASTPTAIWFAATRQFLKHKNLEVELQLLNHFSNSDISSRLSSTLTNLSVIKSPHFAGDFRYDVAPRSDDGQFGIHLCENMNALELLNTFTKLVRGRFSGLPKTSSFQCTSISLTASQAFALETDGEVRRTNAVKFKVLPKEILLCP